MTQISVSSELIREDQLEGVDLDLFNLIEVTTNDSPYRMFLLLPKAEEGDRP